MIVEVIAEDAIRVTIEDDTTAVNVTVAETAAPLVVEVGIQGPPGGASVAWANVTGKPSTFPVAVHTHAQSETHESPDTDAGASSIHHTIGTGANQAAAGDHTHTGYEPSGAVWQHEQNPHPTSDEKAALTGTSGTPSAANPFVTNSDPRLGSGSTHASTHATGGDDALSPSDIGAATSNHNHDLSYAPAGSGVTGGDSHDHSGGDGAQISYSGLSGLPTLGTAAALNVPSTGNAGTAEVVKGDDTRLADSRTPTNHSHAATDVTADATHRFVTDTEKSGWSGKQDALGFTPENSANKGAASGYCPLDADGLVPEDLLPLSTFILDTYTTLQLTENPPEGVTAFVTNASGDPTLTSGWGLYIGDGTDWVLIHSEQYGASVTESATRRFVTDTEKSTWSGKQDALGFTAENSANKGAANGYAPLGADQKVPSANLPTMSAGTVAWDDVTSKPTTFAPSTHASTHSTGQTDAITPSNIGAAASSHTHGATDVTEDSTHRFVTDTDKSTWSGKQDALGFTAENSANKGQANGYAGLGADGLVPTAQLPASSTTFLGLTDTPSSYAGQASKVVRVNSGATALEFVDASTPGAHASTHADGGSDEITPAAIGAAADDHTHTVAIGITVDGSGSVLTTGSKGFRTIPDAATIVGWQIVSDQSGSIVFDIKKCAHANFPTTTSICASAKPTVSSAQINHDETLTGWTTSISAGDILEFVIDSVSTITRATLTLHLQI